MGIINRVGTAAFIIGMAGSVGCGAAASDPGEYTEEEQLDLDELSQDLVDSDHGPAAAHGLRAINTIKLFSQDASSRGLRAVSGLKTAQGLAILAGPSVADTLNVDCSGGQVLASYGGTCTGEPDGLLNRFTGLMSNDEGILAAKYMVKCALPATDSVRVMDYTGGLVTLSGELGVAPEFGVGQCDTSCEQRLSACLGALGN